MELPIFQIDAFASRPFTGNPAAVVPLTSWLADDLLQSIAEENNLAETAFYVRESDGYRIRWFTPAQEVDLCGHATLAAAAVLLESGDGEVVFQSRSGPLSVTRQQDRYTLDFPCIVPAPGDPPPGLLSALGLREATFLRANYCVCVVERQEQVQSLKPNMAELSQVDCFGIIVTAPGQDCDFVSRMFAPQAGIPEDPVTGSAHSALISYWATRLGKKSMFARQISRRGGELWCEHRGDRVGIGGRCIRYMEGRISV